jgi:hypothetical protein
MSGASAFPRAQNPGELTRVHPPSKISLKRTLGMVARIRLGRCFRPCLGGAVCRFNALRRGPLRCPLDILERRFHLPCHMLRNGIVTGRWAKVDGDPEAEACPMSIVPEGSIASLIGHSRSRASDQPAASTSLTGSCFSSESAPDPSIMGVEDEPCMAGAAMAVDG